MQNLFDDVFIEEKILSQDFDDSLLSCLDNAFSAFNRTEQVETKGQSDGEHQFEVEEQLEAENQMAAEVRLIEQLSEEQQLIEQLPEEQQLIQQQPQEQQLIVQQPDEVFSDCDPFIQEQCSESRLLPRKTSPKLNPFLFNEEEASLISPDLFEDDDWDIDLNQGALIPKESPIQIKRPLIARNLIISSPLSSKPSPIVSAAKKSSSHWCLL